MNQILIMIIFSLVFKAFAQGKGYFVLTLILFIRLNYMRLDETGR